MGFLPVTKMMKKIIITYLVLALMGCSASNDGMGSGMENTGTAIRFATGIASAISPRSPVISNGSGLITEDIAGVQILRDDNAVPFASGVTARVTEATIKAEHENNKNLMSLNDNQYFKVDRSDACFMAYYPAGDLETGVVNYTIDGSQDILTSNQEVAKFSTKRDVSFLFSHQLVLLRLQVRAQSDAEAAAFGYLTKAAIEVPVNLELSIDHSEFKLKKSSTSIVKELSFLPGNRQVELKGGTLPIGELMIYPEQFEYITLAFTHKPEESFRLIWDAVPNLLKPGTTNTITIDLKAFEIEFSASVTPWGVGNDGGEEITIGGS